MTIRLPPEQAIEHPRRAAIIAQVTASPGVHLQELARRLGCMTSPVNHHVAVLKRSGLIEEKYEGNLRRFYAVME